MDTKAFRNSLAVSTAINRAAQGSLAPPSGQKPSEWAEASLKIPIGNAVPGPYRLANAPYQREPMDMFTDPDCYRVSLMWGAQVGKTLLGLCVQGYAIEVVPRSQMMMQPSQGDLTTWLETKFNPMVEANRDLQRIIAKPRGREGVNNQKMKSYPGGFLMFAWSGSAKTMRGRSAPLIVCDEVDGYEVTPEGHPVGLLWQRAATFGDEKFLLEISTPTIKGESYIEKAFEAGDQRRFFVRCPFTECKHLQTLKWDRVEWPGKDDPAAEQFPEKAAYLCEGCGAEWNDGHRIAAIRTAESEGGGWIAAKPFKGHASYHLNEMYSTFRRLKDIVQSYLDKMAAGDMQTFQNVSLAETYEEDGEKADPDSLRARMERYAAPVPAGVFLLTAGVDMQTDRLEIEIVGWGLNEESWSIDYLVLWGDPLNSDVWEELEEVINSGWKHESGVSMRISATCVDTGGTGGYTQAAYDWLRGKTGRRIFGVKGGGKWGSPLVAAPNHKQSGKTKRKVDLFIVGSDEAKLTVMRRLAVAKPGPGYCHIPDDREEEWFNQITAEKLITRYVKGHPVREWHATRPRNEALDCRVYALAALKILNPSFKRAKAKLAEAIKALAGRPEPKNEAPSPSALEVTESEKMTSDEKLASVGETAVKLAKVLTAVAAAPKEKPPVEPREKRVKGERRPQGRVIRTTSRTGRNGWKSRN